MRVGLNLMYLVPGETGGTEVYARSLVPALREAAPGIELVAFCGGELCRELRQRPWCEGLRIVRVPAGARSRVRRVLAEQSLLPASVRRERVDVLHSLASTAPALVSAASVVTVHDLIYRRYPAAHTRALATGLRVLVPLAARRADRIVAISGATRDDIVRMLGVAPERIDVVPNGPGAEPGPCTPEPELRRRLGLGTAPIVLSVSAHRAHKNLDRLVDAFARARSEPAPVLVLPGYETGGEGALAARARAAGAGDRVALTGWLSDRDLEGLYAAATCLAFPSLAEGFGLPVLEAMRRGVPVACSDATSLPEVGGDAALYFDPRSVDSIASALERILGDPELRAELAERGRERARAFSWRAAAEATLAAYERALRTRS